MVKGKDIYICAYVYQRSYLYCHKEGYCITSYSFMIETISGEQSFWRKLTVDNNSKFQD